MDTQHFSNHTPTRPLIASSRSPPVKTPHPKPENPHTHIFGCDAARWKQSHYTLCFHRVTPHHASSPNWFNIIIIEACGRACVRADCGGRRFFLGRPKIDCDARNVSVVVCRRPAAHDDGPSTKFPPLAISHPLSRSLSLSFSLQLCNNIPLALCNDGSPPEGKTTSFSCH